jgi:hypothetical protein
MKLDDKDEVVGMQILPTEGEIMIVTSDGKAKRMDQKEFPVQGRYGKGVIAWDLSDKVKLAGVVVDKPNHMATIHTTKGAPKSTRLDAVTMRKRAATKGDVVVEVKPGEEVVSVNVGWLVEKFVAYSTNGHGNGKKNGRAGVNAQGKGNQGKSVATKRAAPPKVKASSKTSSPKRKPAAKAKVTVKKAGTSKKPAKTKPAKKLSKAKTSSPKGKKK